jgi:hypothetical protein
MTHAIRRQTWFVLVMLIACAAAIAGVQAQRGNGNAGSTHIPVVSIVDDSESSVAPALQIQSDGRGHYYNTPNVLNSVITGQGDWRLDALFYDDSAATRKIFLGLNPPIPDTGPSAPVVPPPGLYKVNFGSNCSNMGHKMQDMRGRDQIQCPMNVRFEWSGKMFDLRMNHLNYVGTNPVAVTCIFPDDPSQLCSQWRIWPNVPYESGLRNVARLSYEVTAKGKTTDVIQGLFHVSFSILVVKQ